MRKLVVFQQVSVDGYFVDRNGDMTWTKNDNDEEFNAFSAEDAKNGVAIGAGRCGRRISDRSEPHRSRRGADDVR